MTFMKQQTQYIKELSRARGGSFHQSGCMGMGTSCVGHADSIFLGCQTKNEAKASTQADHVSVTQSTAMKSLSCVQ
jgi:hypothetical protein